MGALRLGSAALLALGALAACLRADELSPFLRDADRAGLVRWMRARDDLVFRRVAPRLARLARGTASDEERRSAPDLFAALQESETPLASVAREVLAFDDGERANFVALEELLGALADGDPPGARADHEALRAELDDLDLEALCFPAFSRLGFRLGGLGRTDEARGTVGWLIERAAQWDDPWTLVWALEWSGQDAWQGGDLEQAAAYLRRAAEFDGRLGADDHRVSLLVDVARIHLARRDLARGEEALREAEDLAAASNSVDARRMTLEQRASLLFELGDLRAALAMVSPWTTPGAQTPHDPAQVRLELLNADLLSDVGRLEAAVAHARRALALATEAEVLSAAPDLHLGARLTLGLLLGDLGQTDEALAELAVAERGFAATGDRRGVGWTWKNRGWALLAAGRHAEALDAFEAGCARGTELNDPTLEGLCALGLAEAGLARARATDVLDEPAVRAALARAEARGRERDDPQTLWRVDAARGELARRAGDLASALVALERAVDGIERWRRRLGTPRLVEQALRLRSDPYREAAFVAAALERPREVLRHAERLQARVLFERRGRREDSPLDARDPVLEGLRQELARAAWALEDDGSEGARAELARLEERLDAALVAQELEQHGPTAPDAWFEREGPDDLVRALRASDLDVALVYLVGEGETLGLRLDRDGLTLVPLPLGGKELAAWIGRLLAPMDALEAGTTDLAHLDFDLEAARFLHERLVAPFGLGPGQHVGLVPDGVLAALPFEALVVAGGRGRFEAGRPHAELAGLELVGDRHPLTYGSSLAGLLAGRARLRSGPWRVLCAPAAVGLPRAEAELALLRRHAGDRALTVTTRATPRDVAGLAKTSAVVHLLAHGRLDARAPAHGHLILGSQTPGAGEERFEAWQAEGLAWDGPLVVLSSCHGARGAWLPGEGLAGLVRGFLLGGAQAVVASPWAVDDAGTLAFMDAFYRALGDEPSVARALYGARRALRQQVDARGLALAHPFFRAAWTLRR